MVVRSTLGLPLGLPNLVGIRGLTGFYPQLIHPISSSMRLTQPSRMTGNKDGKGQTLPLAPGEPAPGEYGSVAYNVQLAVALIGDERVLLASDRSAPTPTCRGPERCPTFTRRADFTAELLCSSWRLFPHPGMSHAQRASERFVPDPIK